MRSALVSARPSASMVVAMLALFVALGGTATALKGKNTVFSDDIKNGQVKAADVAANAITGAKVGDSSITGADVADSSIAGADLGNGSIGAAKIAAGSITGAQVSDAGGGSLTGADLLESSLAGGQISGVDAATLGGVGASGFAPAAEVHAGGRVAVDDLDDGPGIPSQTANLADNGVISVRGSCLDSGGAVAGRLLITASDSDWAAFSSDGLNLIGQTAGQDNNLVNLGPTSAPTQTAGDFGSIASGGASLVGAYHVIVNAQGSDCVFALGALGS